MAANVQRAYERIDQAVQEFLQELTEEFGPSELVVDHVAELEDRVTQLLLQKKTLAENAARASKSMQAEDTGADACASVAPPEDTSSFPVGANVEIHGLSSTAGSRFNGRCGVVTQVNEHGRRVVQLRDVDELPVVKPSNLRAAPVHGTSAAPSRGGLVEIAGLTSERGQLLNGLLGRVLTDLSADERCTVEIFATGQRKAVKATNLVQLQLDDVERRARALLESDRLYDAQLLLQLPGGPEACVAVLRDRLADGTHSEILGDSLELVDIPGKGKGYRATRNIVAGEALLFDTAFCASASGPSLYEDMESQCLAKASCADFLAEKVMALTAGPMMRTNDRSKLVSILNNNVFETSRDPSVGAALFVAASRFNHSCCANAFADTSKTQAVVRAVRCIEAGEEVCISYVPVMGNYQERQERCLGKGFVCGCDRCKLEAREDPQFAVLCRCGEHHFTAQPCASQVQTCPSCSAVYRKAESMSLLREVEAMTEFMQSPMAAAANPLHLIEQLTPVVARVEGPEGRHLVPQLHQRTSQILNCLSGAHYFAATRVPGPHREASFVSAHNYKKKVLAIMARLHGGTPHRDLNYFQALHRMLMGEFPTAEDKLACQAELEELCLLHFGQATLPPGVSKVVCQ